MKRTLRFIVTIQIIVAFLVSFHTPVAFSGQPAPEPWAYEPGPDLTTEMGRELVEINASIPNMPEISNKLVEKQIFRPAFGPISWRMMLKPNSVKILFIGQDGTHIAEAAGRPATAAFGGRAMDLANHFGVKYSVAFMNAYAYTINKQYAVANTPYVVEEASGTKKIRATSVVENTVWLASQDLKSPITQWRNSLIDWIIRNNRESLKLIVVFGGSAKDSIASFLISRGEKVEPKVSFESMTKVQVPEFKVENTFSNKTASVPLMADGGDLYQYLLGRRLNYKDENEKDVKSVLTMLTDTKTKTGIKRADPEAVKKALSKMVFSRQGPHKNGIIHPAQLGGYDLSKISVNGRNTISIKGLRLSDGSTVENEVLVAALPHPTSLSMSGEEEAAKTVNQALTVFDKYRSIWSIDPDEGMQNKFVAKIPYVYGRGDIGPETYDFGTPDSRMVNVSTAARSGQNVIVFGTRDRVQFDPETVTTMTQAQPAESLPDGELFIARPRTLPARIQFDPGPGEKYAKLMVQNLDLGKIFQTKPGKQWDHIVKRRNPRTGKMEEVREIKDGIAAFNVKTHPDHGDFGHYRGTFKNPRILVMADPDGYDDLITSRALTGTRGQYLHGLMQDIGVNDQYLVFKTVPFGMEGASEAEWKVVLGQTAQYRLRVMSEILKDSSPEMILTDGPYAAAEMKQILKELGSRVRIIEIQRDGLANNSGIVEAGKKIALVKGFERSRVEGRMANIPRTHLAYYARNWEGTSGDRALTSSDKTKGLAMAVVAPEWAWSQRATLEKDSQDSIRGFQKFLRDNNLRLPKESVPSYLQRLHRGADERHITEDAA